MAQRTKLTPDMEGPLSAEQTAEATGLRPLFDRMRALASEPSVENRLEMLSMQQKILMQVTTVSLQVDAAEGQIDIEIAEVRELQNYLTARRDSKINMVNLISFGIGGTTGLTSGALGFTTHDQASTVIGIVGGSATAALTLVGLKLRAGGTHELDVPSDMLSEVFEHPSEVSSAYPAPVVAFMNAKAPNDPNGLSRQDRLIRSWVEMGRIPPPDSVKGKEKIAHLTSLPGQKVEQTIGDLDDRQAMLYDLRARMSFMKEDLAILLAGVPEMTGTADK
jgi:hypothetical protein